jgi:hypothetical protein
MFPDGYLWQLSGDGATPTKTQQNTGIKLMIPPFFNSLLSSFSIWERDTNL